MPASRRTFREGQLAAISVITSTENFKSEKINVNINHRLKNPNFSTDIISGSALNYVQFPLDFSIFYGLKCF